MKMREMNDITIYAIAVEFESGIIKNEVHSAAGSFSQRLYVFPKTMYVISENIFFRSRKVIAARGLKGLDLVFCHVD